MDPRQRWVRQARADLGELLDAWDPIGVRGRVARVEDRAPDDEYDCVRDRLLSVLAQGGDRDDVEHVLRREVEDHFGLDPSLVTDATVDRIVGWWEATPPSRQRDKVFQGSADSVATGGRSARRTRRRMLLKLCPRCGRKACSEPCSVGGPWLG